MHTTGIYSVLSAGLLVLFVNTQHATAIERQTNENAPGKKPNILLILADDVGTGDIPYYWDTSLVDMPNIDRLSEMGVTFMDAHSTPLCAPSRYMLLSGNYAHRGVAPKGAWSFNPIGTNQFRPRQKSIAEILRDEADYKTAMFGKWHMGGGVPMKNGAVFNESVTHILSEPTHDWSQPMVDGPQTIGFDTSFITVDGIQKDPYAFFANGMLTIDPLDAKFWKAGDHEMPHGISSIRKPKFAGEGSVDWDSSAYNQILVNETTKFIDDFVASGDDEPFFAYVSLGAVHTPHSPPYLYLNGDKIAGEHVTKHLDLLLEMDKVVGSLVSLIEDNGLAEDTIIIFASDNGGGIQTDPETGHFSNGPLRGSKGMVWEGGHRVPLIFRYDNKEVGFPRGEERDHMVGLNDIYATICDWVGIEIPYTSAQDSVSFADYVASDSSQDGLRTELAVFADKYDDHSIRFGDLKFVLHANQPGKGIKLYDLKNDILETNNLYENPIARIEYSDTIQNMYTRLRELGPCPIDREGEFELSNGEHKGNTVTCDWFKSEKEAKCDEYMEGREYCNSICMNSFHRYLCDRIASTIEPTFKCKDTSERFPVTYNSETKNRACKWAMRKRGYRCKTAVFKEMCPHTCMNCCEDSIQPFHLVGKEHKPEKACSWVAAKPDVRCRKPPSRQLCPTACSVC